MKRERKRPLRNLFKRIRSESSKKNRTKGQIATVIGIGCATALSLGVVTAPLGIALLAVGSALFGGKALFHAQKTKEDLALSHRHELGEDGNCITCGAKYGGTFTINPK